MLTQIYFNSVNSYILGVLNMKNGKMCKGIAILISGFAQSKSDIDYFMTRLSARLVEANYGTLQIDLYGHGDSWGEFEEVTGERIIYNVSDAIKYIEKMFGEIPKFVIARGVYGNIIANSSLSSLYEVVCINPTFNLNKFEREKYDKEIILFNELFEHKKYEDLIVAMGGEIPNTRALKISKIFVDDIFKSSINRCTDNVIVTFDENASIEEQAVCGFIRESEWQNNLIDKVVDKVRRI